MAIPSKIEFLFDLKNSFQKSYINLDNPYRIGTNILKFKLSPEDCIIANIIGSLIFEQLVLC